MTDLSPKSSHIFLRNVALSCHGPGSARETCGEPQAGAGGGPESAGLSWCCRCLVTRIPTVETLFRFKNGNQANKNEEIRSGIVSFFQEQILFPYYVNTFSSDICTSESCVAVHIILKLVV